NYVFAPNLAFDTFRNIASKFDQNISEKTKMFVRYAYNKRTEQRSTNGILTGPAQDGQLPLWRINHSGVVDWVRTVSPSMVVNVRAGVNQYLGLARSDPGLNFNPAELGFPASFVNQLPNKVFPRLNFVTTASAPSGFGASTGGTTEYQNLGRNSRASETTKGFSLQPNFSWVKRTHNVRGGLDTRMTWYTREVTTNLFVLTFDRRYTQRAFNPAEAPSGNSLASFLLGPQACGFAYVLGDKTVLRGGYGVYYVNVVSISASNGFGVQTPLITSVDGDRTSTFALSNPFSQGIASAPGSSLGLETFLGRNVSFSNP